MHASRSRRRGTEGHRSARMDGRTRHVEGVSEAMGKRASRWAILVSCVLWISWSVAAQTEELGRPSPAFRAYRAADGSEASVEFDGTFSTDSDGTIVAYQWLFGDGATGSGATCIHTYARVAEYSVTLRVIDDQGASSMITKTVAVGDLEQKPANVAAASVSSPNATIRSVAPTTAPDGNRVGNRAPAFTLPSLSGETVSLSDFFGRVVILDFWFSTCSSCVSTLPHLEEIATRFAEDVAVIIIVLDRDAGAGRDFFLGRYASLVKLHEAEYDRPTRTAYGVQGTPHTFLIDRSGAIRFSGRPGELTAEFVQSWI